MSDPAQKDKIVKVDWDNQGKIADGLNDYITGTITLQYALTASFVLFVISSVELEITRTHDNGLKVDFKYKGTLTFSQLKDLVKSGVEAYFLSKKPQGQAA